jgi:hypothetical protein
MRFAQSVLLLQVLVCLSATASATDLQNAIGIYHPLPSSSDNLDENTVYSGQPGTFQAYAVLVNPWNANTSSPIATLGGFEFRIELPGNVLLMGVEMPSVCTNFQTPPDFYVGVNRLPITGDMCTLLTLSLGEFSGEKSSIHLAPVSDSASQSVTGSIAVADADDGFSVSEAVPASGSFDNPVFDLYRIKVVEDATWGQVKSLYR